MKMVDKPMLRVTDEFDVAMRSHEAPQFLGETHWMVAWSERSWMPVVLQGQKLEVVATGEKTDVKGRNLDVVATGETDLEASEDIAGRVLSAWKDVRKWKRLWWCQEERGAPAVDVREKKGD